MSSTQPPAWANALKDFIIDAQRQELAPLAAKLNQVDTRLRTVESKQDGMDMRLKALEQGRPLQPSCGSSSSSSTTWQPTYLEVKGFCEYEQVSQKGITRSEASALIGKLLGILPEELKAHVKEFQLRAAKNYAVRVPVTPEYLREIANTWSDELKDPKNKTPDGKLLFITVQRPPTVQKRFSITGKLKEFTQENCDGQSNVRPTFKPDFAVFVEPDGGTAAVEIGRVAEDGTVQWAADGIRLIGMTNASQASEKFAGFKRK